LHEGHAIFTPGYPSTGTFAPLEALAPRASLCETVLQMSADLLLEIGVEELPASFVDGAVGALPGLLTARLAELRLTHGAVRAMGTPRRVAVLCEGVAAAQPDLDEELLGPPARVAFSADKTPTKADWQRLSNGWRRHLDARIQTLETLRSALTGCIGCGCLSLRTCRLFNPDDAVAVRGTGAQLLFDD